MKKVFIALSLIGVVALLILPIYKTTARVGVNAYNKATLRSLGVFLQEYAKANNGNLPHVLSSLPLDLSVDRFRYKSADDQLYDWIYLPQHSAGTVPSPLIVSPIPERRTNPPSRLVLLSDYRVTIVEESALAKYWPKVDFSKHVKK